MQTSHRGRLDVIPLALIGPLAAVALCAACSGRTGPERARAGIAPVEQAGMASTSDPWLALQERTPEPYTTGLPAPLRTELDGTYAKFDPEPPQWWACRRCADYRPVGGVWKLQLDRGIMRIYYEVTGWHSVASYALAGDRLLVFNDGVCPQAVGEYRWSLENRSLILQPVSDPCSFELRAENLGRQPWNSCLPPNDMVAASDHWHKPNGCEASRPDLEPGIAQGLSFTVTLREGNAIKLLPPPDVLANANPAERAAPSGIRVQHSLESIGYGLTRVLWKEGDWVQVETALPYRSMGIQFLGDHVIGWARVLFDGEEIWRGDTSQIWSEYGRFGGYLEVSDFAPGTHVLRAESLGVGGHPVVVAYFGFRE